MIKEYLCAERIGVLLTTVWLKTLPHILYSSSLHVSVLTLVYTHDCFPLGYLDGQQQISHIEKCILFTIFLSKYTDHQGA